MKQLKVKVEEYRNRYRLRYTFNKQTHTISTGLEISSQNLKLCQSISTQIELDAIAGYLKTVDEYKALFNPDRQVLKRESSVTPASTAKPKKSRDYKTTRKQYRLPIITEEFKSLIQAIRECRYDSAHSAYPSSHYADFVECAYWLGLRNQELIGLQVKHCSFEKNEIEISSVLARSKNCSHSKARIRKGTKNGKTRYLPMSDRVREILWNHCKGKQADDLVFTSYRGLAIDDRALQRRVIKPYLKALEIGDKDLYCLRHSFGSRALTQGYNIVSTSYMMGNTPETCLRNYIHIINKPEKLPEI